MGGRWLKTALAAAIGGVLLAPPGLHAEPDPPRAEPRPEALAPEPVPLGAGEAAPALEDAAATAAEPEPEPGPDTAARSEPRAPERPEPVATAAGSSTVVIENFVFSPPTVEIAAGDTVTWTNRDEEPHTATGSGGSFNTGTLGRGDSASHSFAEPGRFAYICALHPNMRGTVVVAGAAGSTGSGGSAAAPDAPSSPAADAGDGAAERRAASLPATGADLLVVAALGALLVAAGAGLRRRCSDGAS